MEKQKPESIKYKKQQHTAVVFMNGISGRRVRTCDMVPNQVLYQAIYFPIISKNGSWDLVSLHAPRVQFL